MSLNKLANHDPSHASWLKLSCKSIKVDEIETYQTIKCKNIECEQDIMINNQPLSAIVSTVQNANGGGLVNGGGGVQISTDANSETTTFSNKAVTERVQMLTDHINQAKSESKEKDETQDFIIGANSTGIQAINNAGYCVIDNMRSNTTKTYSSTEIERRDTILNAKIINNLTLLNQLVDDNSSTASSTYSSNKINTLIAAGGGGGGGGVSIDDTKTSTTTTYSSSKIFTDLGVQSQVVTSEISNRIANDVTLQNNINTVQSNVDTLGTQVQTNLNAVVAGVDSGIEALKTTLLVKDENGDFKNTGNYLGNTYRNENNTGGIRLSDGANSLFQMFSTSYQDAVVNGIATFKTDGTMLKNQHAIISDGGDIDVNSINSKRWITVGNVDDEKECAIDFKDNINNGSVAFGGFEVKGKDAVKRCAFGSLKETANSIGISSYNNTDNIVFSTKTGTETNATPSLTVESDGDIVLNKKTGTDAYLKIDATGKIYTEVAGATTTSNSEYDGIVAMWNTQRNAATVSNTLGDKNIVKIYLPNGVTPGTYNHTLHNVILLTTNGTTKAIYQVWFIGYILSNGVARSTVGYNPSPQNVLNAVEIYNLVSTAHPNQIQNTNDKQHIINHFRSDYEHATSSLVTSVTNIAVLTGDVDNWDHTKPFFANFDINYAAGPQQRATFWLYGSQNGFVYANNSGGHGPIPAGYTEIF